MCKDFISYSHDPIEHKEQVLAFAQALRVNGIDVELDQFHTDEIIDWPRWCEEQISRDHSDFVLCVCTDNYRRSIENKVPPGKGNGVYWERSLIDDELYDEKGNNRFIPILFDSGTDDVIPRIFRGWTYCKIINFDLSDTGYESLIRIITKQPRTIKNTIGKIPDLSSDLRITSDKVNIKPIPNAKDTTNKEYSYNLTLPAAPERNFGRDHIANELAIGIIQNKHKTIIILGGPGLGKTTLTLALANHHIIDRNFGRRRWFIELESANNATTMMESIARVVGLDRLANIETIASHLYSVDCFMILDNLETPWDSAENRSEVEELLRKLGQIDGLTLIASIRGTEVPAGIQWDKLEHLTPLKDCDAQKLFVDIAKNISVEDPHLTRFIKALGGVPLAIDLVARRVGTRSELEEIWNEWERIGVQLAIRRNARKHRLDSVPVSIELSLSSPRLTDIGKFLFILLGQTPSGISKKDREEMLKSTAYEAADEVLAIGLAYTKGDRIDILPPIRDHARRFYPPNWDQESLWIQHYLGLVKSYGIKLGKVEGQIASERLLKEGANIDAAILAAAKGFHYVDAVDALEGVSRIGRLTQTASSLPLQVLAEACCKHDNIKGQASALNAVGEIEFIRSNHEAAQTAWRKAIELFRQSLDRSGEASCLRGIGDIMLEKSLYKEARDHFNNALSIYNSIGNEFGKANCISRIARILLEEGKYDKAEMQFAKAIKSFKVSYDESGELIGWANCLYRIAEINRLKNLYTASISKYDQALKLYRQASAELGIANCIKGLGDIALVTNDYFTASIKFDEARKLYQQLGAVNNEGNAIRGLGDVEEKKENADMAAKYWRKALVLYKKYSDPFNVGSVYVRLAYLETGKSRQECISKARKSWLAIDRNDLIEQYIDSSFNQIKEDLAFDVSSTGEYRWPA